MMPHPITPDSDSKKKLAASFEDAELSDAEVTIAAAQEASTEGVPTTVVKPGLSVNGIPLGRPAGQGKGRKRALHRAETSASHRGEKSGSLGSNAHESKARRAEIREERSAQRKRASSEPPPPRPQRSDAGVTRGSQPLLNFPEEMAAALLRIASKRRLERRDVVGGMSMPAADWVVLRDDAWELRRVYTMAHWASLRDPERRGLGIAEAAQEASGGVMLGVASQPLTERTLRGWLSDYVKAGGRIRLSRRGNHVKTESFLDDPDIAKEAKSWLRKNVQVLCWLL